MMEIWQIIYNYYPQNIPSGYPEYESSNEYQNLQAILKNPPFRVLASSFEDWGSRKYGAKNFVNMTLFTWGNPAYHFRVDVERNNWETYIIFISIISPYFYVYKWNDLWQEDDLSQDHVYLELVEKLQKIFPDHSELSPQNAKELVPNVSKGHKEIGETMVLHCLFTDHIY